MRENGVTGIQRGTRGLHGQIVEVMAQRILSGQIPEGATINVPDLQADLGVSLTAVREALKVLAAKGLVDARQKRGTFVRPRSDWNLLDADMMRWQFDDDDARNCSRNSHEVRGIVEPAAARLAAPRAEDRPGGAGQRDGRDGSARTADAHAVEADLAFHRALLAATRNELLAKMEVVMEPAWPIVTGSCTGSSTSTTRCPATEPSWTPCAARDPDAAEDSHARPARPGEGGSTDRSTEGRRLLA